MNDFRAFRISENEGRASGQLVRATLDELTAGEVVIKTAYSGVNYKDALAGTGTGKILRRFPLIGGIDLAGTVVSSTDTAFHEGDHVLATGYDLSVTHDGGYAEYARVPAGWIVPLPSGLTLREAMAIGTAGFTAALSVADMERNGLSPKEGPVIVTGATGGVGSVAVELLSRLGYTVTALTGKNTAHDFLRELGASEVWSRHELEMGTRPLEKALWAGAVDAVGGDLLAWLTRTMKVGGTIASSGLTAGIALNTTVMPFILRGVKLLGIDSASCDIDTRRTVWQRLATELKPQHLYTHLTEVTLDGLDDAFQILLGGDARGRIVVKI
jgi:acrylyl-CoA reductase (NADPH)